MNVAVSSERTAAQSARHLFPVILCGGAGTRLWPLSRKAYPKQLLPFLSERTMLQETVHRAIEAVDGAPPLVVCSAEHRFLVAEQLAAIEAPHTAILCEPTGRNTGPALAAAALYLRERDPEAVMLALPADHHIGDVAAFSEAVRRAVGAAEDGALVTFGIQPTRPETGYGYIARGEPLSGRDGTFAIERFIEKPDRSTAERLIADERHLWNSGMFVLPAATLIDEIHNHAPDIESACTAAVFARREEGGYVLWDDGAFSRAPNVSIDYAVMEQTRGAAVVPTDLGWSDIGSWRSLRDIAERDADGNVFHGDVVADGVSDSYIRSDGRLVVALGLEDTVVVDTEDAILVGTADRMADVGQMVKRLEGLRREEAQEHRRVHRPWGYYEPIAAGERFQTKHIMVKPGASLSLQMHHHRAEHWVIVSGTGKVTCDGETRLLHENESAFIPLGATHRLENPGRLPLHLIEVQVGAYLGEDDIVRLEDTYGRA